MGVVYSKDNPDFVAGKLSHEFFVPGDFDVLCENPLYDGCMMTSLQKGSLRFGHIETESVADAKLYLYHGDDIVGSCPAGAYWDLDLGGMYFDFGKTIDFVDGERYTLLLPEGSVRTRFREDIVNKELCLNIYGSRSGMDVVGAVSDDVSVSCHNSVLHVGGVPYGMSVEVFAAGGGMVYSHNIDHGEIQIPLLAKGCYLVRVCGKTYKVVNA